MTQMMIMAASDMREGEGGGGMSTCLAPWYNPGVTLTVGNAQKM